MYASAVTLLAICDKAGSYQSMYIYVKVRTLLSQPGCFFCLLAFLLELLLRLFCFLGSLRDKLQRVHSCQSYYQSFETIPFSRKVKHAPKSVPTPSLSPRCNTNKLTCWIIHLRFEIECPGDQQRANRQNTTKSTECSRRSTGEHQGNSWGDALSMERC